MKELIVLIVQTVNLMHDLLIEIFDSLGYSLTDKDLHFWVIGIIGMILFVPTHIIFKFLSKWSITVVSFIYTITVLLVIVFAIEIEQKITGKGNLEFADVMAGVYGFIFLFIIYLAFKIIISKLVGFVNKERPKD
ncbi:hypothetical protein [Neobacillus sp. 114]|uniref:hypothetical protein n=1 Tax=Neobacillus sp. 114 TaxID=3048535 RepID=UPI0024C3E57F|nr:hypothetical protein [Neobacillus sp. 114]